MIDTSTTARAVRSVDLSFLSSRTLGLASLALLAVVAYASTPFNFWVADDYNYIVPKGIDRVISFFDPTVPTRAFYRPLTWTTWAIDYALWGKSPFGWHLTSIGLHVLATLSVTLLTQRLFKVWAIALIAGALFALHPAHTETVSWIGGRADVLCGVFYFLAILLFVYFLQKRAEGVSSVGAYVAALAMAVGAILSKETGATLPLALVLTDLMLVAPARPPGKVAYWRSRIIPHLPFFALVGFYAAMRLYLINAGIVTNTYGGLGATSPQGLLDAAAGNVLALLGVWGAPWFVEDLPNLLKLALLLSTLAALVALVRGLRSRRRRGRDVSAPALYCLLWTAITLLPTFNLSALRWLYIPSFGVCLLAALVIWALARSTREARAHADASMEQGRSMPGLSPSYFFLPTSSFKRRAAYIAAGLLMALWGAGIIYQNVIWYRAGEEARSILTQIRGELPEPAEPTTIYFAGAPSRYDSVLLFNTGLAGAMSYVYESGNVQLHEIDQPLPNPVVAEALADPAAPRLRPNPVFMGYKHGRVYRYSSLEELLQAGTGKE